MVTVGVLPVPDIAPLIIARERGYFAAEGLTVSVRVIQGGSHAVPSMKQGETHFVLMNYVTGIQAHLGDAVDLRYVADSYQGAEGAFVLMVPAGSPLKLLRDLKGKTIAVPTRRSIATLTTEIALSTVGIQPDQVNFVEFPLPEMPKLLAEKQVDAAWATEPFISEAANGGARVLHDLMKEGPMKNWPIAGWACTREFATEHPQTVAAFQRALHRAQVEASNRSAVVGILPTYTKIPPDVAQSIALGVFPTSLEPQRLQRVSDAMRNHGYADRQVDMRELIIPPARRRGHTHRDVLTIHRLAGPSPRPPGRTETMETLLHHDQQRPSQAETLHQRPPAG